MSAVPPLLARLRACQRGQQLARMDLDPARQPHDDVEGRVPDPTFEARDVGPVHAHVVGERLLRGPAGRQPQSPQPVAEGAPVFGQLDHDIQPTRYGADQSTDYQSHLLGFEREMNMKPRIGAVAAVFVAGALALTGCGSGDDGLQQPRDGQFPNQNSAKKEGGTFEFASAGFTSAKSMSIKLPKGLLDAMGSQQGLLVTGYEAKVRDMPGAEYCAFDLKIHYADGGKELASAPRGGSVSLEEQTAAQKRNIEDAIAAAMKDAEQKGYTGTSINEGLTKAYGPASSGLWAVLQWVGNNSDAVTALWNENAFSNWTGTYEDAIALIHKRIDDDAQAAKDQAASVPASINVANRLFGTSEGKPASELPADPTGSGVYVSDDLQSATVIRNCAPQPFDDSSDEELRFPLVVDGKEKELASAFVTVMKGGDLTVREHKIDGYVLGSDGHWVKD